MAAAAVAALRHILYDGNRRVFGQKRKTRCCGAAFVASKSLSLSRANIIPLPPPRATADRNEAVASPSLTLSTPVMSAIGCVRISTFLLICRKIRLAVTATERALPCFFARPTKARRGAAAGTI